MDQSGAKAGPPKDGGGKTSKTRSCVAMCCHVLPRAMFWEKPWLYRLDRLKLQIVPVLSNSPA